MNYEYIKTLKDDDTILVKTTLLLYMYSYYEEKGLFDDNLKVLFKNILKIVKYNDFKFEPPYFKIQVKYVKLMFENAPTSIFTDNSFKEDTEYFVKKKII